MRRFSMFALAMVSFACLVGCPSTPTPNPPPAPDADAAPDIPPDADVVDADAEASASTCTSWCKHAAVLKCPAVQPTKAGATCIEVCANIQTGPTAARMNLRCRTAARTCAVADACEH